MRPPGSQEYDVDNRYRGLKPAQDDKAGQRFLNQYIRSKQLADRNPVGDRPQHEGRIIMPAMGGTIAIAQLPGNIGNTDAQVSYRNPFRAQPS
jgi:hypothetical protein